MEVTIDTVITLLSVGQAYVHLRKYVALGTWHVSSDEHVACKM